MISGSKLNLIISSFVPENLLFLTRVVRSIVSSSIGRRAPIHVSFGIDIYFFLNADFAARVFCKMKRLKIYELYESIPPF